MELYNEQYKQRIKRDKRMVENNLRTLGDTISGKKREYFSSGGSVPHNQKQMESICGFFDLPLPANSCPFDDVNEQMDYYFEHIGVMKRHVTLSGNWWKSGTTPLLCELKDMPYVVALLPTKMGGYYYIDSRTGVRVKVTKKNKDAVKPEAFCFYKPLPDEALTPMDYIRFLGHGVNLADVLLLILTTALIALVGTLTPFATKAAFSSVVPSGDRSLLIPLGVMLVSTAIGSWMMRAVQMSLNERIKIKLDVVAENAVYSRMLYLPLTFYGDKSAGGLAERFAALAKIPDLCADILFSGLLTMAVSLVYLLQVFFIAPKLAFPAIIVYLCVLLMLFITVGQEKKLILQQLHGAEVNNGLVFSFISGIQKLKVSGSEKRAFAKWLSSYTEKARAAYSTKFPLVARPQMLTTISCLGMLWFYMIAFQNDLSVAQFAAFTSSYGLAMASLSTISTAGTSLAYMRPALEMGRPILAQVPERSDTQQKVESLSGRIEINDVYFKYTEDGPNILNGVSISIEAGEYIALVGKSGCGKSTIMKLLLGFEKPQQGSIFYDGMDVDSVDKRSLRRKIGTVLQNGRLFAGDIYSNITISAPWLTEEDAWDAAEKAGIADDIRHMPKGMHTQISEGGGGISGGQRQRIVIARAIAPKPKVLFFDEATSALDNLTQKIVTESMNSLHCTRIVIAHRLSTIRECDRIIALDKGRIVEEGNYDELIAKNGFFADLVSRQQVK